MLVAMNNIHWCVALCVVNCTLDRRSCCWHSTSPRSIASYSSMIAVFAYPICIRGSPSQYCHNVWCEKKVWLPAGEKNMCIRFDRIHERDRHPDRHRMTAKIVQMTQNCSGISIKYHKACYADLTVNPCYWLAQSNYRRMVFASAANASGRESCSYVIMQISAAIMAKRYGAVPPCEVAISTLV